MRTSTSSMTGLARKRAHRSSTSARAADSDAASILKQMHLPTRTPLTPSKPRVGSDRSIVAPCGSATPSRSCTSTTTENAVMPSLYGHKGVVPEHGDGRGHVDLGGHRDIVAEAPAQQLLAGGRRREIAV